MSQAVILQLLIYQLAPGIYGYQVVFASEEVASDAGFASIKEALEAAADITGDVRGFEVAYGGFLVGTYPLESLRTSAEAIAQHAIGTAAALRD